MHSNFTIHLNFSSFDEHQHHHHIATKLPTMIKIKREFHLTSRAWTRKKKVKYGKRVYLLLSLTPHPHIRMMMTFSVLIYMREIVEHARNEKNCWRGEKSGKEEEKFNYGRQRTKHPVVEVSRSAKLWKIAENVESKKV